MGLLFRAVKPDLQPVAPAWGTTPWPFTPDDSATLLPAPTEADVLGLAVVGGFISIVTSLLAQSPLRAYTNGVEIDTPLILRNPSPGSGNRTLIDFLGEYVEDMTLHGNYLGVLGPTSSTGWPDFWWPVPWPQWQADYTPATYGRYLVAQESYAASDIFHVRVGGGTGALIGAGIMERHRDLTAGAVAAESFSRRLYDAAASPAGHIQHPNPDLTQVQAEQLKAGFMAAARRRGWVVTPVGTQIQPLNSTAVESQMVEARKWNAQNLGIALGMPPALVGAESSSQTYRNSEAIYRQFLVTTIAGRYLAPLEQQLTLQCLPPGTVAKFDTEGILRGDTRERFELALSGLAGGLLTADEARELVDMPPGKEVAADADLNAVALMVQKLYLGVGVVISADEARAILNDAGANLVGPLTERKTDGQ